VGGTAVCCGGRGYLPQRGWHIVDGAALPGADLHADRHTRRQRDVFAVDVDRAARKTNSSRKHQTLDLGGRGRGSRGLRLYRGARVAQGTGLTLVDGIARDLENKQPLIRRNRWGVLDRGASCRLSSCRLRQQAGR